MDLTQQLSNLYRDAPVSFSFTGKGKLGVDTYSFNVLIVIGFMFIVFFFYVKNNLKDQVHVDFGIASDQTCKSSYTEF